MIEFLLRFVGLAVAVVFGAIAFQSWTFGEPPPWSIVAERVEARVVEARVNSSRIGNGTIRHTPVVMIDLGAEPVALEGLEPAFFDHHQGNAEAIVANFTPGDAISVRVVNGIAMADRQDLFQTAHASFMTLMTLVVGLIGLVMFVAFSPDRKTRQEKRA